MYHYSIPHDWKLPRSSDILSGSAKVRGEGEKGEGTGVQEQGEGASLFIPLHPSRGSWALAASRKLSRITTAASSSTFARASGGSALVAAWRARSAAVMADDDDAGDDARPPSPRETSASRIRERAKTVLDRSSHKTAGTSSGCRSAAAPPPPPPPLRSAQRRSTTPLHSRPLSQPCGSMGHPTTSHPQRRSLARTDACVAKLCRRAAAAGCAAGEAKATAGYEEDNEGATRGGSQGGAGRRTVEFARAKDAAASHRPLEARGVCKAHLAGAIVQRENPRSKRWRRRKKARHKVARPPSKNAKGKALRSSAHSLESSQPACGVRETCRRVEFEQMR